METIKLNYYENETIRRAINTHMRHIRCLEDRQDCEQEIWANLYAFMPLDEDEAVKIIDRSAMRFRRNYINPTRGQYEARDNDAYDLGDGNYQRIAHRSPAD
ncbi:MAG: hypothetical protein C0436_00285 [Alphaproteobacteria bacterium]|nr:hypothetical protein [Alphaproteobacteria bacterium]